MDSQNKVIVDLDAIRSNFSLACNLAPASKNIAVVKADAYGHGAIQVAIALQSQAPAFAVATLEEAMQLRDASIQKPILVLEGLCSSDGIEVAAQNDLWLMMHNHEQVANLAAAKLRAPLGCWIKVDTGMHRLGFDVDELPAVLERMQSTPHFNERTVLCTHLSSADDRSSDKTESQAARAKECASTHQLPLSICNSAGILAWPETHADWNRPGYMLYGNSPFSGPDDYAEQLKPAMTFTSRLLSIRQVSEGSSVGYGGRWTASRESTIGTVGIGYAGGYPRSAADGTPTLVNGEIAPLVGTVSMDMITIDLTEHASVAVGDTVVLWGDGLSVNEVAKHSNTIGYELLTRPSTGVETIYVGAS